MTPPPSPLPASGGEGENISRLHVTSVAAFRLRVDAACRALGSAQKVADALGRPHRTIYSWRKGYRVPLLKDIPGILEQLEHVTNVHRKDSPQRR